MERKLAGAFRAAGGDLILAYGGGPVRAASMPLRKAQVAAIWAIAGHLLQRNPSEAQVVLPTGTGKTAVMTAVPYLLRSRRVLVVVPSDLIRGQVQREFATLRVLKAAGAVQEGTPLPQVRAIRQQLRNAADWQALEDYDVIVATPQCISPHYAGVVAPPPGFIDCVLVDEAHHSPAATWVELLDSIDAPKALLTATPFRADGKRLRGDIVYWYSLAEAIADGVYAPIDYIAVQLQDGENRDLTLARAAAARIRSKLHKSTGSQIVIRTDRQSEAARLKDVYRSTGLELPVLLGSSKKNEVDEIIEGLEAGRYQGVIVVGVLTEGFDLPRLKIAVYHVKHHSFAATLQFVGRLARTRDDLRMQPELLAFADDLTGETTELYREDSSWRELLPQIADAAVAKQQEIRRYTQAFFNKPDTLSIESIQPRLFARVFEYPAAVQRIALTERLKKIGNAKVIEQFGDEDQRLVALISVRKNHPDWLNTVLFDTPEYRLHILCVDLRQRYIFVHTDSEAEALAILNHYGLGEAVSVPAESFNRALHTFGIHAYSSVGLRATTLRSAIGASYKSLAGHAAELGVVVSDEANSVAGHLVGRFASTLGEQSVGVALESSKVWQTARGALLDFRSWCDDVGTRLDSRAAGAQPPNLRVSVAERIQSYPRNPIVAVVPVELFSRTSILEVSTLRPLQDYRIRVRSAGETLLLGIERDQRLVSTMTVNLDGVISSRGTALLCDVDGERTSLVDLFNEFPLMVHYASGASTIKHSLRMPTPAGIALAPEMLVAKNWGTVDIRRESKPARTGFAMNIQQASMALLGVEPRDFVLVDDAANELADILLIRPLSATACDARLVHCKWSSEDFSGSRLHDIYELCGQASRSSLWCESSRFFAEIYRRYQNRSATHLISGSDADFEAIITTWVNRPPMTDFHVVAVQPGLSNSALGGWREGRTLIGSTANWCQQMGARFEFWLAP